MPSITDAPNWYDIGPSEGRTYLRREYQWVPVPAYDRDGTLTVTQSKGERAGSAWQTDAYAVEEGSPVGPPRPGRVFLLRKDAVRPRDEVSEYEVLIADAGGHLDNCTCRAFACRGYGCKHADSLRDAVESGRI